MKPLRFFRSCLLGLALACLRFYQWVISPVVHCLSGPACGCRFDPSCSEYSRLALREHGLRQGGWLALRRILRCHPWHPGGIDPVPRSTDFRRTQSRTQSGCRPDFSSTAVDAPVPDLKTRSLPGIPTFFKK